MIKQGQKEWLYVLYVCIYLEEKGGTHAYIRGKIAGIYLDAGNHSHRVNKEITGG